jgi:RNA polymerase sigma-70 factor (ECF subfamily)
MDLPAIALPGMLPAASLTRPARRLGPAGYHPSRLPRPSLPELATATGRTMDRAATERELPEPVNADREARRAEDAALLARIVDRDERAVEALYARYSGPLYSLAYQVTGADRFAQEVVQETFIAVWKDATRFDPTRGSLAPWLFSLARHKAIDLVRREANIRKRTADVDMELEVASDDVDNEVWQNVRRDRVRAAIAQLSEPQRTALELAFFAGLTHVEVAERLGIPLGTAKTRIRTALLKLRDALGTSVSEDEDDDPASTTARWTTEASSS